MCPSNTTVYRNTLKREQARHETQQWVMRCLPTADSIVEIGRKSRSWIKIGSIFGRPYYRSSLWYTLLFVCRLLSSVTFCIVTKWYVLAKNCLKEWIGNQGQKVDFRVAAIFLLLVSPLRLPRRPFLLYFCPYSPDGTNWLSSSKACAYCHIVQSELKPEVVLATIIDPERCK